MGRRRIPHPPHARRKADQLGGLGSDADPIRAMFTIGGRDQATEIGDK